MIGLSQIDFYILLAGWIFTVSILSYFNWISFGIPIVQSIIISLCIILGVLHIWSNSVR